MKISLEGKILLAVMLADCVISLLLIQLGVLMEVNPIMNFLLEQGMVVFLVVKILVSVLLVLAFERIRFAYPKKIRRIKVGQWVGIMSYPVMTIFLHVFYSFSLGG